MKVFDAEVYRNYTLFMFKDVGSGSIEIFEQYPGKKFDIKSLQNALQADTLIGFNSAKYDIPISRIALAGADCAMLKAASDDIIVNELAPWHLEDRYPCVKLNVDHIDICEPTPGVMVSLKSYAGRIHAPRMQDLPIEPSAAITPAQRTLLREYCSNDLDVTERLYRQIEERIKLREQMSDQYGIDLRSKSDAQIAEAVIKHEVQKLTGREVKRPMIAPGTTYKYRSPGFIRFQTAQLQAVHAQVKNARYVVAENGSIDLPEELANLKISLGTSTYQMGIGGLHSTEKSTAHHADTEHFLQDSDVASFYPAIILRCNLYPKHLGAEFIDVYRDIVFRRLAAKAAMKAATDSDLRAQHHVVQESLKIVLNGSFGKFGSKYSILYSPDLLIQTTLTGQLALLQLIEWLELHGISVVSANTDGIVIKCPRAKRDDMAGIIKFWEFFSAFEMEATEYSALYSKDVNNYLAVKPDGKVKAKGLYAEAGLMKNPTGAIAVEAVTQYLTKGTSISTTVRGCQDIRKFVTIRSVKGGGVQGDQYLGKTVRWYYSTAGQAITYKTNGNKVAKSDGARALMELPTTLPDDIDYAVYEAEAKAILIVIGA